MRFGRRQHKNSMSWRLLECFQKSVESRRREHVDFIDDVNFIAAFVGEEIYFIPQVAHILHTGIGCGIYLDKVQEVTFTHRLAVGTGITGMIGDRFRQAIDSFSQQPGSGCLTRTARSGEKIRVGYALPSNCVA